MAQTLASSAAADVVEGTDAVKLFPWSSCRDVGWVSLLGFPEAGRVRNKVSLVSGKFISFFIISGIC